MLAIRGRLFFDLGFKVGRLVVGKVFEIHLPTPNFPTYTDSLGQSRSIAAILYLARVMIDAAYFTTQIGCFPWCLVRQGLLFLLKNIRFYVDKSGDHAMAS